MVCDKENLTEKNSFYESLLSLIMSPLKRRP